ncbi:MAG: helix-turn-helix domain-containing protein [Betaproteobacteria bacterium]|nr:helix-turn-helix domain-containing protein [Betaproteobacteria bacterium]
MIKQNRSLSRGLRILRMFNDIPTPSLTDISAAVELTKTTCRRFLITLEEEGYVAYDEALKRYSLRPLVLELGYAALGSMSVPDLAAPYMQELADQTGGAVSLSVLEGDQIVFVGRNVAAAEKRKLVTMNLHIGMRMPAHCTAMGRVLIGADHEDIRDFVTRMRVEKMTPKTLVNRAQLTKAIQEAARRGYEVVADQLSLGYGAVAVPLTPASPRRYALAVSLSTAGYSQARFVREVLPALLEVAEKLNRITARGGQGNG